MKSTFAHLRTAIVHEFSTGYVGSEKVVEQMILLFPNADLYFVADFLPDGQREWLRGIVPRTTFIQRMPFARKYYKHYLPLMPLAIEGLDLSQYDLIISSSHAVAKGVLTGPDQTHVTYCHTPVRYAWDLQHEYLREAGLTRGLKRALTRLLLHYVRLWDVRTSNGVDLFVANSRYIGRRIEKVYGRKSTVVYPPVDVNFFTLPLDLKGQPEAEYYITASRLVPYKRIELIIESFNRLPSKRLVVVGDGPHLVRCRALAGPNVEVVGYQSREKLLKLLQGAKAFLFAAQEDFGISVVEAQACGLPVICYGRGGATESVIEGETGLFFHQQTPEAIVQAVEQFERQSAHFSKQRIRKNAERFGPEIFQRDFAENVLAAMKGRLTTRFDPADDKCLV